MPVSSLHSYDCFIKSTHPHHRLEGGVTLTATALIGPFGPAPRPICGRFKLLISVIEPHMGIMTLAVDIPRHYPGFHISASA